MCLVSLGLLDPNKFLHGFTFPQPSFSKTCWVRFPQLHGTNTYRRLVSLGLENLTKYVTHFPRPSRPKQILTSVYFPSAWFLKNLLGYVSLSFTAPTCREESFHCASFPSAFWTQIIFDTGLLSLSLVSQKLVGYVSLSFTAPTRTEESFHSALRT